MKIGDKINLNNSKAVIVAQAKDGTFIGDNNGNLFKVTPDWKLAKVESPIPIGSIVETNLGTRGTVISFEDWQAATNVSHFDPTGKVFVRTTPSFVTWDFTNIWNMVRDAGQAFDIGTKLAHVDAPYVHKYTVVSKKEWFEKNPDRRPTDYPTAKIFMNYVSNSKDCVYSSCPKNYCEVKTKIEVVPTNQAPFKVGDIIRGKPEHVESGEALTGLLKVTALSGSSWGDAVRLGTNYSVSFTYKWYEIAKPQVGDWMEVIPGRETCAHRDGMYKVKITRLTGVDFDAVDETGIEAVNCRFVNWQLSSAPGENNSGKKYFEAYDSNARTWESLNQKYKDKWNNLAKFIANEKKGD